MVNVAVVGATGNVGREMLQTLAERNFPVDEVYALASSKSVGKEVSFGEEKVLKVQNLADFDSEVIQLGTGDFTATGNFDFRHIRGIDGENAFHAFAERNFANGERRVQTVVFTGDANAFVNLNTFAVAFDDFGVNAQGVAGFKFGKNCFV